MDRAEEINLYLYITVTVAMQSARRHPLFCGQNVEIGFERSQPVDVTHRIRWHFAEVLSDHLSKERVTRGDAAAPRTATFASVGFSSFYLSVQFVHAVALFLFFIVAWCL